jgi:serine/threonine-protein kinase RsbW
MTAAALVSRMGMNYDDVDDVRMAAEEAFIYAVDTHSDDDEVTFTFLVGDDCLEMDVTLGSETDVSDEEVDRRTSYAMFILQSVCDAYELTSDEDGRKALRLHKSSGDANDV